MGLPLLHSTLKTVVSSLLLVESDIRDAIPKEVFPVLVKNFSDREVQFRKNQVLCHILPSLEGVFAPEKGN